VVRATPEFMLLADCCRSNFPADAVSPGLPDTPLDWNRFLRLARFHRVQGLAWRTLSSFGPDVPDDIAEALSDDAATIAASNLAAARECAELRRMFDSAGVPILFLKGLTLGTLAYGTSFAKSAVDIDLLVPEDMLGRSAQLLGSVGYTPVEPREHDPEALRRWHRSRKESLWAKQGTQLRIDLHSRLSDNPRLLAILGTNSPRRDVDVGNGIALPTLADDELFAYLAVHGSSSAWFRLKWIADFAALLSPLSSAEIARRYRRSLDLGSGSASAQALLVADALFGSLRDDDRLRTELRTGRAARLLCSAALRQLAGRSEPVEPTAGKFGTATIHWTQLLLLPGIGFKVSELVRQGRSAVSARF
jgi:hypothetical protein